MSLAAPHPDLDAWCDQALALHRAGRLQEAAPIYETVLQIDPMRFAALHYFGVLHIQVGNAAGGAELIGRALEVRPGDLEALNNLATALNGLGRHGEALDCCERGLARQPLDAGLHGNRGVALSALDRPAEALESYDAVARLRPDQAKAHFSRGSLLHALGRLDEAAQALARAAALQPGFVEAHYNLGRVLREAKRPHEALAAFDAAIALRPQDAGLLCARANVLCDLARPTEALDGYDRALALEPDHFESWLNRMVALRDLRRPDEALESCERALALRPEHAEAHNKRGTALYEFQRLDDALENLERAVALDPGNAQAHLNRAIVLNQQRRFDEAMSAFDRSLALEPDNAEAQFHQAMCRLATADTEAGWRQYEARWRSTQFAEAVRGFAMPLWLGDEDLTGRTILVHAEQGLGDALQFCRYLPLLAQRGATVAFEVYPALVRLMSRMAGPAVVLARGSALPDCDFHVPLMSLPLALGVGAGDAAEPYLEADPEDAAAWARKLDGLGGLKVGLCWAGGARPDQPIAHAIDLRRSLPLEAFRPVADIEGVQMFSLQKGPPAAELQTWAGPPIHDFTDELRDFADTAALIANLDLVIACDTSTAHLAGAMGRPVFILNRFDACWRWGVQARGQTPWYPSATMFWQDRPGDWGPVIQAVVDLLEQRSGTTALQPRL